MKSILFFAFAIIFSCSVAQNKDKARQQIWDILERNNPDAHYFLTSLYQMPTKFTSGNVTITSSAPSDFMIYSQRYKPMEILSDISTVVHEGCHMYQSQKPNVLLAERGQLDFKVDYSVYFISRTEEYLVKHTSTFPSIRMASEIPEPLQSFRYATYIKTNQSILGTQQSGVYGLMDEWSAYYNGFKTTVLNFPEYASASAENEMDPYFNFLSDAGSIRMAYPEFKYYILHYLEYAGRNEKAVYDQVMANEDFKLAFQAIDKAFSKVMALFESRKMEIMKIAESKELNFRESRGFYMIGNRGVGSYNEEYSRYEEAINSEKFKQIIEYIYQ